MLESLNSVNQLLGGVFVPLLLLELIAFVRLRQLGWTRIKEMLANGVTSLVFIPAAAIGLALWVWIFTAVEGWVPWSIPTNGWTLAAAILLADFVYYWEHRIEHERRVLWDLYHSVHHSSPQYDQTTSLRLGVLDALISPVFSLVLVLVGFSPMVALLATGFIVAYQTWLHTELIDKLPAWFEFVFNTPSHHRGHHGSVAPYLDVNYGGVLILWDRLFGTFQAEHERPIYGLTRPLNSSNPVDIQLAQIRGLWRDLKQDRTWRDRWTRLWSRPDWKSADDHSSARSNV